MNVRTKGNCRERKRDVIFRGSHQIRNWNNELGKLGNWKQIEKGINYALTLYDLGERIGQNFNYKIRRIMEKTSFERRV